MTRFRKLACKEVAGPYPSDIGRLLDRGTGRKFSPRQLVGGILLVRAHERPRGAPALRRAGRAGGPRRALLRRLHLHRVSTLLMAHGQLEKPRYCQTVGNQQRRFPTVWKYHGHNFP